MTQTTTKEQVIEGTMKTIEEMGKYHLNKEIKEYIRRRLNRAYELGYHDGWTNEFQIQRSQIPL